MPPHKTHPGKSCVTHYKHSIHSFWRRHCASFTWMAKDRVIGMGGKNVSIQYQARLNRCIQQQGWRVVSISTKGFRREVKNLSKKLVWFHYQRQEVSQSNETDETFTPWTRNCICFSCYLCVRIINFDDIVWHYHIYSKWSAMSSW